MSLRSAKTPEGYVVRRIGPAGETAWRWDKDDLVSVCHGHKGPWIPTSKASIPPDVFRKLATLIITDEEAE